MSDFREAMWGVVQSAVSELDFDFDVVCLGALRAARANGGLARVRAALGLNSEGRLRRPSQTTRASPTSLRSESRTGRACSSSSRWSSSSVPMRTGPLNHLLGREDPPPAEEQQRPADEDRRVVHRLPGESVLPRNADRVGRHQEHDADEEHPDDRDRVDPLVVLTERPCAVLERVSHPVAQDHGEDERDVEADHRDTGADVVADEEVVERRQHECRGEHADRDDRVPRDAVARDLAPQLVPGTARSRENANIIRDADVTEAVRQNICAISR